MTVPDSSPAPDEASPSLMRSAVWVAIGALIAAAIVCVIWVLVGPQNDIIGRAFLTILLLSGFAGAALFDANMAPRRPSWYVLASMVGWVVILLTGAFKIWMPVVASFTWWDNPVSRLMEFLGIVLVIRLGLIHVRIYLASHARYVTTFTTIITVLTVVLVAALAVMLLIPLTFPRELHYPELYWRIVVATTILAAVGTALIPLINALTVPRVPKERQPAGAPYPDTAYAQPPQEWPTYVDGVTPLPALPDGSPDWTAYYTGYPTTVSQAIAPVSMMPVPPDPSPESWAPPQPATRQQPTAPAAPNAYEGYPPPPPLPPQA